MIEVVVEHGNQPGELLAFLVRQRRRTALGGVDQEVEEPKPS
jgi:hypothetical protein